MALKLIVILVGATLIVWLVLKLRLYVGCGAAASPNYLAGIPKGELRTLKNICRGDFDRMYRLIEYEKSRNPGISNKEACRRAISSYSRDNR